MPMMYIKSSIWSGFEIKNWRSISIKPKIGRDLNSAKMHFCSKFGNCNFNWWWVMVCTSSKFWLWSSIWPWRSRSITPQNNRDLNQGLLHLLSKFGDHCLNGWWVIARTSKCLPHAQTDGRTDGHTDRQTQATTIPEGQNWPRVKMLVRYSRSGVECVSKIKSNFSIICYAIHGTMCLQLTQFSCDDRELCTLCYYHHQTGCMNYCLGLGHKTIACAVYLTMFIFAAPTTIYFHIVHFVNSVKFSNNVMETKREKQSWDSTGCYPKLISPGKVHQSWGVPW